MVGWHFAQWLTLLQLLDLDIPEMNLRSLRLEADEAFGQIAFSRADFRAVDLCDDGAVVLAGSLGRVPFADGLGDFVLELLIVLGFELFALQKIKKGVIGISALD